MPSPVPASSQGRGNTSSAQDACHGQSGRWKGRRYATTAIRRVRHPGAFVCSAARPSPVGRQGLSRERLPSPVRPRRGDYQLSEQRGAASLERRLTEGESCSARSRRTSRPVGSSAPRSCTWTAIASRAFTCELISLSREGAVSSSIRVLERRRREHDAAAASCTTQRTIRAPTCSPANCRPGPSAAPTLSAPRTSSPTTSSRSEPRSLRPTERVSPLARHLRVRSLVPRVKAKGQDTHPGRGSPPNDERTHRGHAIERAGVLLRTGNAGLVAYLLQRASTDHGMSPDFLRSAFSSCRLGRNLLDNPHVAPLGCSTSTSPATISGVPRPVSTQTGSGLFTAYHSPALSPTSQRPGGRWPSRAARGGRRPS